MTELTKQKITKIASFACVLHCLIAPIFIILAPTIGHTFHNPIIEMGIFLISILFGLSIIYSGYCNHKKKHAAILFFFGACFWLANSIAELVFKTHFHFELLIIGTILVLVSYKVNHDQKKTCCTNHHH
ncbi:MAG: MerC domain-containing protein [Candidatus Margulisiibacteriota bacterium]